MDKVWQIVAIRSNGIKHVLPKVYTDRAYALVITNGMNQDYRPNHDGLDTVCVLLEVAVCKSTKY